MKVLVAHTLPPSEGAATRIPGEFDLHEAAAAVGSVLPGAIIRGIEGRDEEFEGLLREHRPDVVFNLCEAPLGRPELEAHAAALWESLGVRFTGAPSRALALCRVKDRANSVLASEGIPVPASGTFPCVVKPAEEDGSAWIGRESICRDLEEVRLAVARMPARALVEAFIPGREFAVSAWGRGRAEHFSIGETVFANGLELVTYEAKWLPESSDYRDSPVSYETEIDAGLRGALVEAAGRVWSAVGARGYLRVDARLDGSGVPHVLDVNPNPALGRSGGIRAAAEAAGWSWGRFVRAQVDWAR
jgi:D-alanine-D-alanine ligase